jgi:hypothetical protein
VKITIYVPDGAYGRLKSMAAQRGVSITTLILQAVQVLGKRQRKSSVRRVKLPIIRSKHPGTLDLDNARIYDIIPFP